MRISTKSYMDMLQQGIRRSERQLARLTEQLTSGKRINRPSDDPVGASQVLRAHAAVKATTSSQQVLTQAQQMNVALDSALAELTAPLQTAYNAALKATATGLGDSGRTACAEEVRSAMERIIRVGNYESNGVYLLAGTDNRETPLSEVGGIIEYRGNTQVVEIAIAPSRNCQITVTGQDVFNFADAVTGERAVSEVDANLFEVMKDLAQAIEMGDEDSIREHMGQLQTLQEHVLTQRGKVGAYGLRLEQNLELAKDAETQSRIVLAEVEDVDIVQAMIEAERQKMAYQSALAATAQLAQIPTLFELMR